MDLNSARIFASVVQKGSLSAASAQLNIPVATVSRRISELEQSLGVRLLERSTRQLRLTEAGATLFEFVARGVDEFNAGLLALQDRENELRGRLNISLPPNFQPWWKLLSDFQRKYPNVEMNVFFNERQVDLIEDGFDVALRIASVEQQSVIARKLFTYRHKLVATREFIRTVGQPQTPQDLIHFPCVAWGKQDSIIRWRLGNDIVNLNPHIKSNDYAFMRFLAESNNYITELPDSLLKNNNPDNPLIELLPEFPLPRLDLNLIYPSKKQLSRIARVYIDFCVENAAHYLTQTPMEE